MKQPDEPRNEPVSAAVATMSMIESEGAAHPEAELIERLIAQDERAFRELYRMHSADVYRIGRQFVHSDAEAEEVVQEVFIAAFRYIGRFRGQSRLRTWLYRITVNRALKRRRWWTRRREDGPDGLARRIGQGIAPDTHAEDREALALVAGCLDQLEARKRTVLVLHELEGLDTKEIAEILQCPRSTVLTRLSRARSDLLRLARRAGVRTSQGE
jgi:RNA polymerase sigma-70 factor (ECF subfamily)